MGGFAVLLRKELREQWRTSRLLVVGAIFLVFGFASPLLAKYLPELLSHADGSIQVTFATPTTRDAVDQFLKNVGNGVFVAILLAMGAVAREKERGTAALVLTKPVGRAAFLGAKFAALALTFLVGVTLAGLAAYAYTVALFDAPPAGGFAGCCALLLLAILVYAALTFLGSTLARSPLPAAGLGVSAFVAMAVLGAIPGIGRFTPGALSPAARALALGESPPDLAPALLGNAALIVIALILSWLMFRRQELGT